MHIYNKIILIFEKYSTTIKLRCILYREISSKKKKKKLLQIRLFSQSVK